jgi:hypothetical protein
MSKYVVLFVVAVMICAATSASAVVTQIYANDFGTAAQKADMAITGNIVWNQWGDYYSPDILSDGLWAVATNVGYNPDGATLTKKVDAPAGYLISNPVFDARLGGYPSSWGTRGYIALSRDGVNWEHQAYQTDQNWWGIFYTASAAGDPNYVGLSSVWIRMTLQDWGGNNPQGASVAAGGSIILNANVVPEPGSMLALGTGLMGLFGFAIRRRK